mgnify:CR=1 FL=1
MADGGRGGRPRIDGSLHPAFTPVAEALERQLAGFSNVLNFHGLTGLVDSLWPYVALAYLSALGLWRGEHLGGAPPRSARRL